MYASDDHTYAASDARALFGSEDRLARLLASHKDIETYCTTLALLSRHLLNHGTDEWTRATAETILAFFDDECRHLRDDAERNLYPLILSTARLAADAASINQLIDRLIAGNAEIERVWAMLSEELACVKDGEKKWLRKTQVRRFVKLNTDQIMLEKAELLPLVSTIV
jgi:hypothetical protein